MPCMGPSYNKNEADRAYEDVVKLLAKNYAQLSHPLDGEFWVESRQEVFADLKKAIHDVFKQESYESF